ncbi:secreted protein [sediment metagenome]|uniref:Secreted protein n=1 Tax=sediment metagenome TaxID=749907 RepID=D9PIT8_9ZZZZ
MKRHLILLSLFLSVCSLLLLGSQAVTADDAEKEARAVFVKMVAAAKAGNTAEFKSYLTKEDLTEMEQQGMVDLMMMMMAGEDPEQFRAEVNGDRAEFKKEVKESSGGGNSTSTTTVHMLKEGGQWKFGKPKAPK